MKSKTLLAAWVWAIALLPLVGCCPRPTRCANSATPAVLDLPPDFQVTRADWIDNQRPAAGWFLGLRMLRGKGLKERNGVFPIHVMQAELPQWEGTPLLKDDLILGVNGVPLKKSPVDQFAYAVKITIKTGRKLTVRRWRKGKVTTVTLDCSNMRPDQKTIPDLTKGGSPDNTRDWTLGPIGANGWGYSRNTKHGGSSKARQLLITLIDKDGPAYGTLKVGDVLLGVNGARFTTDARKALAAGINQAEKEENKGRLTLQVWRDGNEQELALSLPVLGTYSRTTPFDCPKSDKIIARGVAYMLNNRETLLKPEGWINYINGLGLLATGRDDVMPSVKDLAHGSLLKPGETLSVEKHVGMQCWWWSYKTLFLCEYYLRTKDDAVLPTIQEYATKIAMGQSGAGTWGHTYAARENAGHLHGHLGGYGAINQMGLTMMIVLPLARKCGVTNKEVLDAIQRGDDFFRFFIGKGTIPYGDHGAAPWFDDNGKSGSAAIFFDLMGNRRGTRFFSEMILASTPGGREAGHTGHFWSHLWGGVGAARGGDKALQVFMREMNPIFTLERQHNGRFAFQDNVGEKGDRGKPKSKWDCTGARLLQLCVPRRRLYITGKETPAESHLTEQRIQELLRAGRLNIDMEARKKLTVPEILTLLQDPLSPTRVIGARTLEEREINCVDQLIRMLKSKNRYARYGAAEALGRAGFASKEAAHKLIQMMESDTDTQFRLYAIAALTNANPRLGLLTVARPAIPVLLRMAVKPAADDPRKVLQHDIARALFYSGRAEARKGLVPEHGLEGVDRRLLVPAISELLTNKNGWARSTVSNCIYPLLTETERQQLWGDIHRATRDIAPSGIMFADGVRTDGLALMQANHIKEGVQMTIDFMNEPGWGSGRRQQAAIQILHDYGGAAKAALPALRDLKTAWTKRKGSEKRLAKLVAAIQAIETGPAQELKSIQPFINKE